VELRGLGDIQAQLEKQNGTILAIAADKVADAKKVHAKNDLPFDILSDPDAEVIESYGLLFREPFRKLDIALPANILIDSSGKVVWKRVAESVQDRVDPAELDRIIREKLDA